MTNERDIVWEGKRFWVLRSHPFKGKAVTQIMKIGSVVSESVETYKAGPDGESIAVVRAKYLDQKAIDKFESEMNVWRLEDPAKLAFPDNGNCANGKIILVFP